MAVPQRRQIDHDAPRKHRRDISVYDAVAGQVTSEGFLSAHPRSLRSQDPALSKTFPIPPEKALFQRKGREFRGEEDPYWADRKLTPQQKLPDSELLKAIHAYASDFYGRAVGDGGTVNYQSMDETALLGLGILLEEMADSVLGETGDLAFTEGEVINKGSKDSGSNEAVRSSEMPTKESSAAATSKITTIGDVNEEEEVRMPKRRKTRHT